MPGASEAELRVELFLLALTLVDLVDADVELGPEVFTGNAMLMDTVEKKYKT